MKLSTYPTLSFVFGVMVGRVVSNAEHAEAIMEQAHNTSLEPVGLFDRAEAILAALPPYINEGAGWLFVVVLCWESLEYLDSLIDLK
jgi:hypothetical protein